MPFETGKVSRHFYDKLLLLIRTSPAFIHYMGVYDCDFCQFEERSATGEIFVPGQGVIYVAPRLIEHYVATHWYSPPPEFVTAVLKCPASPSATYRKAFLDNGGRDMVRALKADQRRYDDSC